MLALTSESAVGQVFNIATGVAATVNQLAKSLREITGKTALKLIHTNPRPGDIRHSYAGIGKAKKILGYYQRFPLEGAWLTSPSCTLKAPFNLSKID